MKVLITGVQSILGKFLVDRLSPLHEVYGMDHTAEAVSGIDRVFTCKDFSQIPEVDAVIHVAGRAEDTIDVDKSLEYLENNVGLTRCIFDWFRQSNAKQFYYLSSIKVLGNREGEVELLEEMEPMPFGLLGESKLMAEKYLLDKWTMDKKVYVLRTAMMHGHGLLLNDNAKRIFNWVERGMPYVFGSFDCKRSLTSLDNLQYVLAQMLVKDVPGGIYHVTDDGWISSIEFCRLVGDVLDKKPRIWHLGKGLFKFIALIMEAFGGFFNLYEYRKLSLNFVSSNRKLKDVLGLEAMPFPLNQSLKDSALEYAKVWEVEKKMLNKSKAL